MNWTVCRQHDGQGRLQIVHRLDTGRPAAIVATKTSVRITGAWCLKTTEDTHEFSIELHAATAEMHALAEGDTFRELPLEAEVGHGRSKLADTGVKVVAKTG